MSNLTLHAEIKLGCCEWGCPISDNAHTLCSCTQEIDESEESRVPRTIEVELTGDLVGSCCAGDEVTVLGIVRVLSAEPSSGQCQMAPSDGGGGGGGSDGDDDDDDDGWVDNAGGQRVSLGIAACVHALQVVWPWG